MPFVSIAFENLITNRSFVSVDEHAKQYLCVAYFSVFGKTFSAKCSVGFFRFYTAFKIQSGYIIKHDIQLCVEKVSPFFGKYVVG